MTEALILSEGVPRGQNIPSQTTFLAPVCLELVLANLCVGNYHSNVCNR